MKPEQIIDIEKLPADPVLPDRLPRLFWHFMRQVRGLLCLMLLINVAAGILNALMPYFLGRIVDGMTAPGGAEHATATLKALTPWIGAFVALCLVLLPLLGMAWEYLNSMVFIPHFGNMVRRQTHWYTLRHSMGYFQNDFAGRIANKVQQMGPAMRDVISRMAGALVYVAVFAVSTTILLSGADRWLLVPMGVWLVLYIFILRFFVPRVRKRSVLLSDSYSRMVGRIVDSYTNIMTVKLFARREHEDEFVLQSLQEHSGTFRNKNRQIVFMNAVLSSTNALMIGVITMLSIALWRDGQITPGQVAMILPLVAQLNNQMHWIMWEVTGIFEWIGTTEDSMETLAKPHRVTDPEGARPARIAGGEILYDNVSFHYGKGSGVLDNLSLHIPAGQKVGLVGHSGAGKSTLASLLLRFYDLEGGRILIDGQDIALHTQDSLRAHIAMVTQDTSLLHRSIMDNIRYGRPDATEEEAIEAARKAHAHEFIPELQDERGRKGYEAHVGERGVKLSGGQRQRIAIARIILKDAPILILDEATSALDSEIESYIQAQLAGLMEGKTVIAIAHRLSTIARMDRLVVMDRGRIVEDGTHAELIRRDGPYAHMWKLQSGGFLPE